ncbi:MAG TPA: 1-acyl-sn-glycerol-3-phosphate acyltransferase [Solibacterales bacterium]|nr:1-acyl-sn-glycerol-3-phosphate acyltransferase [Bryobacterales bacterium]
MIEALRSIRVWLSSGLLIASWSISVWLVSLFDRHPLRLRTARCFRRLGEALAAVNPWKIHFSGRENIRPGQTYVVVCNHQSLADIPLVAHLRIDAKWLAKAELFRIPIVGWMMSLARDIPVERGDRRKAAQALLQAARVLRQGCSLVFFPEGTRSTDGAVLPFNEGPFQLALREGIPVLPVVLDGSGAALPRATWRFSGSYDIHLRVLPESPSEGRDPKDTAGFRDEVRQRIVEGLAEIRTQAPAP